MFIFNVNYYYLYYISVKVMYCFTLYSSGSDSPLRKKIVQSGQIMKRINAHLIGDLWYEDNMI